MLLYAELKDNSEMNVLMSRSGDSSWLLWQSRHDAALLVWQVKPLCSLPLCSQAANALATIAIFLMRAENAQGAGKLISFQ